MKQVRRNRTLGFTIALLVFALCMMAASGPIAWAQGPGGAEDQVPQVLPPTATPEDAPDQSNLDPVPPEVDGDSTPSSPEGNTEVLSQSCSVADIDAFLSRYGSPLAGHGATFVSAGQTWNVDPRLIVAIAGAESSLGRNGSCATQRHNPFGWGGGWPDCWTFNTWDDAINRVTRGIRELYFDAWHLYTIHAIGQRYCGSGCQNWESNVRWYYAAMGGNPDTNNLTFSACPGGGPTITVNRVWTDDTHDNAKTNFRPGDPIRYLVEVTNHSGSTIHAPTDWIVDGPRRILDGHWTLEYRPGSATWYLSTNIPSDAPGGTYTLRASVTANGQTSSQTATFTVEQRQNSPVRLEALWTADYNDNPKNTFYPGDQIRYRVRAFNPNTAWVQASFTWEATGPRQINYWSGPWNLGPGVSDYGFNTTVPADAPTGNYVLRATLSYAGHNSSLSHNFSVQTRSCGGSISFGQTVYGDISQSYQRCHWTFHGNQGQVVTTNMRRNNFTSLDPYLELWNPSGQMEAYDDDGAGYPNAVIQNHRLQQTGTYTIVARGWGNTTGLYSLSLERGSSGSSGNLARGKYAYASSVERGSDEFAATRATDGNMGTRWSSRQAYEGGQDFEWIVVDLGAWYPINRVVLRWEAAYATVYNIQVWNGSDWDIVRWNNNGRGGVETLDFSTRSGRWVAMAGNQKINRSWGYSLWEFEIYGRASSANAANETPEGTEVPAEGQPELFAAREDRPKPAMEVGQNELPAELLKGLLKQIDQAPPEGDAQ